jgi:DNA (cytosine-5)-methyltransferase 1
MKDIKVFEGFAGYGGCSFALKKAGINHKIVGYSEIHKGQIKIYQQNHKGVKNYGDITKINPKELPDFDLFCGGFPCQDVSIAGLRDLNRGKTKTIYNVLDIIMIKRPKYILLENVKGILSIEKGEFIKEIVRILKSYGYAVSYELLYSKAYGNPQNRPRVWFAAELKDTAFGFNPFPKKEELKIKVKDLLEKEVSKDYYLTDYQLERAKERSIIREKPFEKRINLDVATTLTTRNPKNSPADTTFIKDNKGYRVFTERECFRLMGFHKDEIKLKDINKTDKYFSAGNGWDIIVVSKIFKNWLKGYIKV